jgi:hypothetical protein
MTTTSFPFENNSIDKYEISRLGSHLIKRIVLMKYETGSGHSIVRDQFPREKMAIGQGMITSMFAGGAVIGLSIGGFIIQHYGWQTTFFTIIPIAAHGAR